ncbi:hypothetical protein HPP92_007557 [Vanilla planifolia]|uniref:Uncharacterized protein n=1 Tax=Vanilla planifolia TaxID=51239 RepID=A0A835RKH5_VANPL|nr:hypothetical protein HPP92_007557 [Vanilla planifolia]
MSVQAFTFLQSSEQNSLEVHYAGTPSKGSKSVEDFLGEAKLLQRGSPMQQTMEKQSRAIFDIEAAPSELDCSQQVLVPESDQFHEGHGGSELEKTCFRCLFVFKYSTIGTTSWRAFTKNI